jgi:hypothetical protein
MPGGFCASRAFVLCLGAVLVLPASSLARKPWTSDAAQPRGFIDIRTGMNIVTSDDANGFSQSLSATYGALDHLSVRAGADYLLDHDGTLAAGGFWLGVGSPWWTSGRKAWRPYLLVEPRISLGLNFFDLENQGGSFAGAFTEQPSLFTAESSLEIRPALFASLQVMARTFIFASVGGTFALSLNAPADGSRAAFLSTLSYTVGVNVNLTGRPETRGFGFILGFRRTKNHVDHALDLLAPFAELGFHLDVPNLTISLGGTINTLPAPGTETVGVVSLSLTWSYDTLCNQHDPLCDPEQRPVIPSGE